MTTTTSETLLDDLTVINTDYSTLYEQLNTVQLGLAELKQMINLLRVYSTDNLNNKMQIKITTQNGSPPQVIQRQERHNKWLDFCNGLEATHGKCTPDNVAIFEQELREFDTTLGDAYPLLIERPWPQSKEALQALLVELGSDVLAIELTESKEVIGVVYVS